MVSKKEMVSFYQIFLAVLAFVGFALLTMTFTFPESFEVYLAQCFFIGTGIVCLLFAFGTWFYNSNFRDTRLHSRIICIVALLILTIGNIVCGVMIAGTYMGDEIGGFEKDIWDETDLLFIMIGVIMGVVVGVLMIPMDIFLIVRIFQKQRKYKD